MSNNMKYNEFHEIINDIKTVRLMALENEPVFTLSKQVVFFHYIKTLSLLDAIQILTQKNKTNEAGIILRSLLNLFINLKWLTSNDSERRMQRYADFEIIGKKKKMDSSGICPDNEIEKQKTEKTKQQFQEIITKYNLNPKKWKDITWWSGKSIRQMADDVNLLEDYNKVYSYLSFEEHTDPSTITNHLSYSTNEENLYIINPDDYFIALILWTAISYYFHVEQIVAKIFKITFKEQNVDLKILANKYLKEAIKPNT